MIRRSTNIPRMRAAFGRAAALTIVVMVTLLFWAAGALPASTAAIQIAQAKREYLIKAAFIHDVMQATQWPQARAESLILCVLGRDPFGAAWASIDGRPVGSGKLEIAHLANDADLGRCHALFVATSERNRWPRVHAALATRPVLTISEMTGFSQDGGMVTLMNVDNRLRFDVNITAVRRVGLSISTDVLEQASMVHAQAALFRHP
jgi:hypothetical protein